MLPLTAILKDIYDQAEDFGQVLGLEGSDYIDSTLARLHRDEVNDRTSLQEWIKENFGKYNVVKILRKLDLDFDDLAEVNTLINIWFNYRGVGDLLPKVRPFELAGNILEVAKQIQVFPGNYDVRRILYVQLRLLFRCLLWHYEPVTINQFLEADRENSDSTNLSDYLSSANLNQLCQLLHASKTVSYRPYNSSCSQQTLLCSDKNTIYLSTLEALSLKAENSLTIEDTTLFISMVLELVSGWINDQEEPIIPKGNRVASVEDNGFQILAKSFDKDGNGTEISGNKTLKIGDTVLLHALEKNKIWASKLKPMPTGKQWEMPLEDHLKKEPMKKGVRIFISSSNHDKQWLDLFKTHLKVYTIENKNMTIWDPSSVVIGNDIKIEKRKALRQSNFCLMLVSPYYLASDATREEFKSIIAKAKKKEIRLYWVLVDSCGFEATSLKNIKPIHDTTTPLSQLAGGEQSSAIMKICRHINENSG